MARIIVHRVPRQYVCRVYPLIYRGLAKCLEDTSRSPEQVLEELMAEDGEELYAIVLDKRNFVGFITLRVFHFESEVWGTIGLLYADQQKVRDLLSEESQNLDVLALGLPQMEQLLHDRGCTHMNYVTERSGFRRLGPRLGFRSRLVEWVKEVS